MTYIRVIKSCASRLYQSGKQERGPWATAVVIFLILTNDWILSKIYRYADDAKLCRAAGMLKI